MEHQGLEKMASSAPMLGKENVEKVVIITPNSGGLGKVLIREDTIIANIQGCATCGRGQFTCSGVKNQWSALCWGKQSDKKYYCLLVLLSATFALSLIGTIFFCFTNTINDAILSNMVIRNNSLAFSLWQHPTVRPVMKVHIFNYTNWQKVRSGSTERLHVEEVGPYVYSQQLDRVNVEFKDDRLSFQELNHFRYLPEKTVGAHFDQIFVPNLPLLGVVSKVVSIRLNSLGQFSLNSALNWANHPDAFVKLPVHRFLWGYDDSIINTAKPFLSFLGQWKFEKFGLLASKNGTLTEQFTINTGVNDKSRMNILEMVDGQEELPYWGSADCNSLDATDGSIFPPSMLDRQTPLHVFYPQLCRRLPFVYEGDVEMSGGIQLLRYRMPSDVFDDPSRNPANQCYCEIDTGICPPNGIINVTQCSMGVPALVSFPHFHLGDPRLRTDITGLHPKPGLHDSFIDIHPTLGLALNGKSSLQINFQVKKTPMFSALNYLDEGLILPIAWIEMGIEELPESVRSLIYHGTYSTAAVQLGLTVICIISLIVSTICLLVMIVRKRQKPCITLKKIPVETELNNQSSSTLKKIPVETELKNKSSSPLKKISVETELKNKSSSPLKKISVETELTNKSSS